MATAKLLLSDLVSTVDRVPSNYIRPISDRPNLSDVRVSEDQSIPLIDLEGLDGPNHSRIIQNIGLACQQDGFFQVHALHNTNMNELILASSYQSNMGAFPLTFFFVRLLN